ncbi:hypothetical protein DSL72_006751 [Monilinia vaccinii-corymbosi]|uniref:Uncharacterized protein n=1 Tax=Monilinia vaccinii-corymbosi TaxID=61207 RepID=A0A8A3PN77_9HELO|nr:hypothetical protein DSL72_006751 [Monilinia vaccinii-corymbosi]
MWDTFRNNFIDDCTSCGLDGTNLKCAQCKNNNNGQNPNPTIALNSGIGYANGQLTCALK